MLNIILIVITVIVLGFVIIVAMQPCEFSVTRSTAIAAPPEVVFEQVNDLHKWEAWSPWLKMDPNAKKTYEGPGAGTGAIYSWAGNSKIGEGQMSITECRPDELIRFTLQFKKPMKATHVAEFTFKPDGAQTVVTWTMSGRANFVGKAIGLFMNFDKMVGGQFERGLATMKSLAEAEARA